MKDKPYKVEPHFVPGRRGGKRNIGWKVVRGGVLIKSYRFKENAEVRAAVLNSLEEPLLEAPKVGDNYWRLTETGHWLYTWTGDEEDLVALRSRKAFAHMVR